jgi:hypothetical protein
MIVSTLPGKLVLGGSGIRAASRFRSAILADFEIRGFAISTFRPAGTASLSFFLSSLWSMQHCDIEKRAKLSCFARSALCFPSVVPFTRVRPESIRNVGSAALPQAKSDVTGWSAQMYTAFVGVNHSWPGWNALRSFPH